MPGDLRLDANSSGASQAFKALAPIEATREPAAPAASATSQASSTTDLPSPRLHTDLALNRLVLEFFNAQGTLTYSIPSQKQLDAYRLAAFAGGAQHTAPTG